jgi:CRP-like cAMP-binding protein
MHLFSGASPADLDALAAIADSHAYPAGERLFDTGHPPDALSYIVLGMVELRVEGKDAAFVTLSSGQVLGPVAFFEGGTQHRSAHTRESTRMVRIPFDKLRQLLDQRPTLALVFYRNAATTFAQHLRQLAAERPDRPYL